jgi:Protein of unknown function (DUF4230)
MSLRASYRSSHMRISRQLVSLSTLAVGIVLGFLLLSAFAHVAQTGLWSRFAGYVTGRSTSIDVSSAAVVEKIRQLSRLETVVYSLDKIVEGDRQSAYLPDFLVGDKLLLVAHGEVIAGVDLGQLKTGDVFVKAMPFTFDCPRRKCSPRASITGAQKSIPGRPAYLSRRI